ncbi:MAG: AbrB/MazE/SpoVT family DNA-binding domain-containing protein [Verrucomicrobiota bacterium]|jgi:antitoxin MazE
MSATLKLVPIGNSKGIRIPAEIIRRYHLGELIRLEEMADGIMLKSASVQKLSFAEAAEEMAKEKEGASEFLLWEESFASDGLNDEEFEGWPR